MPTLKQKKAASKMVENGGNISKAMLEVGYSPNTANTPQKLTESKGFKEVMEKYFPDDYLMKHNNELLNLKKLESVKIPENPEEDLILELKDTLKKSGCFFRSIHKTEKGTYCFYFAPDGNAKKSALDMIYKLKGVYSSDKSAEKIADKVSEIKFTFDDSQHTAN